MVASRFNKLKSSATVAAATTAVPAKVVASADAALKPGDTVEITVDNETGKVKSMEKVPAKVAETFPTRFQTPEKPADPHAMFDENTKRWLVPGDKGYSELVVASVPEGIDDATVMTAEKSAAIEKLVADVQVSTNKTVANLKAAAAPTTTPPPTAAHHQTVKDLASKLARSEADIRDIINMFSIPVRGEGPKPKRGATPKLYSVNDVQHAITVIQNFKPED